ncbi:ribosomal-protein-alanine N-acetyltransferase [Oscillatoriales cyanobacterium USR001]|nr:ribosomal-protein-alanine N-acetyltransferase [Oscillatoriales cyanobacterium USR001]
MIEIKHLSLEDLSAAVELDRLCFGGLWTLEGYRRELESPNSDLLGLWVEGKGKKEEGRRKREEGRDPFDFAQGKNQEQTSLASLPPTPPLPHSPTLIGLACLWAILGEGHITMLGIHPDYQGQGFGKTLLYSLLKLAHQRQLEWATLEVRASNFAAISLYQKFGFKEAGRRRGYYQEPEEDALILWRSGLQQPEFEEDLVKSIAKSVRS